MENTLKVVEKIGSTCAGQGSFIVSTLFSTLKSWLTAKTKTDSCIVLIHTLQVVLEKANVPDSDAVGYIQQLLQLAKSIVLDETTLKLLSTVSNHLYTKLPQQQQQLVVNQVIADLFTPSPQFSPFDNPQHSFYLCLVSALLVGCLQQVQIPNLSNLCKQLIQTSLNVQIPEQVSLSCIHAFASIMNKAGGTCSI